jgi:hypothetical protein
MTLGNHAIELNENQILYLFSTSAQVIAAIYGLTLTGFVFFRSELNRQEFEDETLVDAVESLKRRYFVSPLHRACWIPNRGESDCARQCQRRAVTSGWLSGQSEGRLSSHC